MSTVLPISDMIENIQKLFQAIRANPNRTQVDELCLSATNAIDIIKHRDATHELDVCRRELVAMRSKALKMRSSCPEPIEEPYIPPGGGEPLRPVPYSKYVACFVPEYMKLEAKLEAAKDSHARCPTPEAAKCVTKAAKKLAVYGCQSYNIFAKTVRAASQKQAAADEKAAYLRGARLQARNPLELSVKSATPATAFEYSEFRAKMCDRVVREYKKDILLLEKMRTDRVAACKKADEDKARALALKSEMDLLPRERRIRVLEISMQKYQAAKQARRNLDSVLALLERKQEALKQAARKHQLAVELCDAHRAKYLADLKKRKAAL